MQVCAVLQAMSLDYRAFKWLAVEANSAQTDLDEEDITRGARKEETRRL